MQQIDIPVDLYDSPQEFVVVMPLWGVQKSSVHLYLEKDILVIIGERKVPTLKKNLTQTMGSCFRWSFQRKIKLPGSVAFDRIHSQLTSENILVVVVPKVILSEEIQVDIE